MTAQSPVSSITDINTLASVAGAVGFEIVDVASFLDDLEAHSKEQARALDALSGCAANITAANDATAQILLSSAKTSAQSQAAICQTVDLVRDAGQRTRSVASWVQSVGERTGKVSGTLDAVRENNSEIARISAQVNTLAINAKIEAARAGEAGRGFAVVADAINDLSKKTSQAAKQITENIEELSGWIRDLGREADSVNLEAAMVLSQSEQTDSALGLMEETIKTEHDLNARLRQKTEHVKDAGTTLAPAVQDIERTVRATSQGIKKAHKRVENLVESSEQIVQLTAGLGGTTADAPFIAWAQQTARAVSEGLEGMVAKGTISESALFDQSYVPVQGSNPEQVTTRATNFLDAFLPAYQEPALEFDPRVVFCAAVDVNGYLPTHNRKFSHPQTNDTTWNIANCRNRRIFDDRVGLKAGRNTAPFLLQVYRRDMGGGDFRVMKDLSSPIFVNGRHWGGLRLAYSY